MTDERWPRTEAAALPWVTTAQMIEVDRIMIEDLQIELKQMMENAGRNLAMLTQALVAPQHVTVLAGSGGNGGGGLVAARHLVNHGVNVTVVLSRAADDFWGVPAHQLAILQRLGIVVVEADPTQIGEPDVIIDALIGYSLRGAPHGAALDLIGTANLMPTPVICLDVPSGIDSTTGDAPGAVVDAMATLTLAAPKVGLRDSTRVGRLFVGDISVPPLVYKTLGFSTRPIFDGSWIIEVNP